MITSISCVMLVPIDLRDQVNALAESLGYGPGNFSVALVGQSGNRWYGCHSWCKQSFLDRLEGPESGEGWPASMIVSAVNGGDPLENWEQTLSGMGLSLENVEEA